MKPKKATLPRLSEKLDFFNLNGEIKKKQKGQLNIT
jgi:hypothetical protein